MSGYHPPTVTDTDDTPTPAYPALAHMEQRPELQPLSYGKEPFWQAPVTPASGQAYIPTWNWLWHRRSTLPEDSRTLTLRSVNGLLHHLGTVRVAHSHLTRAGAITWPMQPRDVLPGYYRIQVPTWPFSGTVVHPLGDSARLETEGLVWVAHPTLALLLELREQGVVQEVLIEDAWIARAYTDFRKWFAHLAQRRIELLDAIDRAATDAARAAYRQERDALEAGYAKALHLITTGEGGRTRRPDWTHAIQASHAAAMWFRAWQWTYTGRPVLAMEGVDQLTVLADDLPAVMSRATPPFTFDPSGHQLDALTPAPDGEDR